MFGRESKHQQQQQLSNPLLLTLQAVHDAAKEQTLRSQQHSELMAAISEQTKAINSLVESNREMVGVLAQLIVDTSDEPDAAVDAVATGMGDVRGGYVGKQGS